MAFSPWSKGSSSALGWDWWWIEEYSPNTEQFNRRCFGCEDSCNWGWTISWAISHRSSTLIRHLRRKKRARWFACWSYPFIWYWGGYPPLSSGSSWIQFCFAGCCPGTQCICFGTHIWIDSSSSIRLISECKLINLKSTSVSSPAAYQTHTTCRCPATISPACSRGPPVLHKHSPT